MQNFDVLADESSIETTTKALTEHGFIPQVVATGAEAFAKIKELIPAGASVMNGASKTLHDIGFVEYLKQDHSGWNNLHKAVLLEKDPVKQSDMRKHAVISDFYLGSAHAISETGEILIASATGSQLPALTFTAQNIILVVGVQKITKTLALAQERLRKYVFPLEDARMKEVGYGGSNLAKELILHNESPKMGRKFYVIFVKEKLGF